MRPIGKAHGDRALADVDHAGQAHHRFVHGHAMGGADLFQRCIAGQAAQLVQLTAVADTHGRRHQAGTHALANHREQLLHRVVEALDLGHRPGLAAVAVQHRLDVQRARSEERPADLQSQQSSA
ncbi:hypothetical protein G6F58_012907 [Rhizopus delemar]|nr:hypothetical protein G6F58_012907 [Rhizopus delemar]